MLLSQPNQEVKVFCNILHLHPYNQGNQQNGVMEGDGHLCKRNVFKLKNVWFTSPNAVVLISKSNQVLVCKVALVNCCVIT